MKEHRFKADGLTLNCLDYGGEGKRPILFIHGGSAHAHWWDFIAPAFFADFHALALDLRGHGESEWSDDWAYGSPPHVADLHPVVVRCGFAAPVFVWGFIGGRYRLASLCG